MLSGVMQRSVVVISLVYVMASRDERANARDISGHRSFVQGVRHRGAADEPARRARAARRGSQTPTR